MKALRKYARQLLNASCRQQLKELSLLKNKGYCVICERDTVFVVYNSWLRDHYKCRRCQSIPRNRALVNALNRFSPEWRQLHVHESSPGGPLSNYLRRSCTSYSSSHYFSDVPRGSYKNNDRSEDLSQMTLEDDSVDVFVTSDVFEHVLEPAKAFAEIARVVRPGGTHVFTMPWYPSLKTSVRRARLTTGDTIEHLLEPVYHGNPIDSRGSLVTFDWGLDFTDFIRRHGGMETTIYLEIDRKKGLDADFLEVFVSRKPREAS
jgi:SAM-dependent methyltransferase